MISAIALAAFALYPADKITGHWESPVSPNGNVTSVVFKTDGTFEGFVNRKAFVSGQYHFENDVLSFTDNGCEGKKGVYKMIFFSKNDSLRSEAISDSCIERREGMSRLVLGRVKE